MAAFFCTSLKVLILFLLLFFFFFFCLSMKCIRGLWPCSPSNWENSLLQRVQNCNFAHMFNILNALKRTKKTNALKRLPWFSQLCVPGCCLMSIVLSIPLHLFRDHISWETTHLKMLIFQFFLGILLHRKERYLAPLVVTVLLNWTRQGTHSVAECRQYGTAHTYTSKLVRLSFCQGLWSLRAVVETGSNYAELITLSVLCFV